MRRGRFLVTAERRIPFDPLTLFERVRHGKPSRGFYAGERLLWRLAKRNKAGSSHHGRATDSRAAMDGHLFPRRQGVDEFIDELLGFSRLRRDMAIGDGKSPKPHLLVLTGAGLVLQL
jgi:hypothetical protein